MNELSQAFVAHIAELERRSLDGDTFATKSLCAIALVKTGWVIGDPEPRDDDDPDGGELIDFAIFKRAA